MTTPAPAHGDLVWGVLDSFVTYVRAVEGSVTVVAPATVTADGRFRFPLLSVDGDTATFGGGVRFVAHGGALTLHIEEPRITATPGPPHARTLSVRGTRATNSEGGRLAFADLHPDDSATLTTDATVAFDFRYRAGTMLAPIDLAAGTERNIIMDLDRDKIFDDAYLEADALLDAAEFNRTSPYNVPGYRPVRQEFRHAPIEVVGEIPEDLEGVYLRTGTNPQFDDDNVRMHSFNGAGMLHQIQISNGRATYSNAYVRTPKFEVEAHLGREVYIEFGEIATGGPAVLPKIETVQAKIDAGLIPLPTLLERGTGGTSVRYHHGRLYCLTESGYAFVLNTREEDGLLVIDGTGHNETWNGEWDGPFSAHPTVDPRNDDLYNLSLAQDGRIIAAHIHEGELVKQHTVHQQGDAPGARMAWLHDFFLTANHIVFPDVSMRADATALFTEDASVMRFDRDRVLRWGVLPRAFDEHTRVTWFETSVPGTVWHVINAWERESGDEIVLYGPVFATYPSSVPIHTPLEPAADVKTWTLNLSTGVVTDERLLNDHGYERPSMNLDFTGRENRYAYLLDEHGDGYMGVGICKFDLLDETEAAYLDYGGMYGGEALFVPRKDATAEDDGYLVDLLMAEEHAELIIVDARDLSELARLRLPQRVPFGVHGCWIGTREIDEIGVRRGDPSAE